MFRHLFSRGVVKRALTTTLGLGAGASIAYTQQPYLKQYFQRNYMAHAAGSWQPHPELPPPKTMKEAVAYNDYAPGYSEPIPQYPEDMPTTGIVKKVVASNLETHIMNPEKDVFVQFSQENCPSCQSFQRITDAMSFAFRDVPTVQFLEMKGTGNYLPGILTAEEEVLYPTFKFFPAGTHKQQQITRAKDFVKMVREYNQKILAEHNENDPVPPQLEPVLAKSRFEGVGYSMPMSGGNQEEYVWETFIDVMWDQSKIKFDKDLVKKQLQILEPTLRREITHTIRSNLPGYELLSSLSPCGSNWDQFQDAMLLRGVGSTKVSEFYDAMTDLRRCILQRYPIENAFWKDMMKSSIHMCKTLDIVQQAKRHEGLTADDSHQFFTQYAQMIKQQNNEFSTEKVEEKRALDSIPRQQ